MAVAPASLARAATTTAADGDDVAALWGREAVAGGVRATSATAAGVFTDNSGCDVAEELSDGWQRSADDEQIRFDDAIDPSQRQRAMITSASDGPRLREQGRGFTDIHTLAQEMAQVKSGFVNMPGKMETLMTDETTVKEPMKKMNKRPTFCIRGICRLYTIGIGRQKRMRSLKIFAAAVTMKSTAMLMHSPPIRMSQAVEMGLQANIRAKTMPMV